ncbi:MAG: ribonuclease HII [Candidatus Spechtbacterales bacterium]
MPLDFLYEKKLRKQGYRVVFGIDEVGVGPLAGPVVACAVTIPAFFVFGNIARSIKIIKKLKDSKKLSHKQREDFLRSFEDRGELAWEIASVYPRVIDRINIYEARRKAAMISAQKLEKSIGRKADIIILDGRGRIAINREQQAIVKGDEKVALCAIASIIAKVARDRAMLRYHKKYPEYRFDSHKGYGTKMHFQMLKKYGPSEIHRVSFRLA